MPVGSREMLVSAVANGANAVYFGVPGWNARGRTIDFSLDDVREMIEYARLHGVKTYLAMNILIFEEELRALPEKLASIIKLRPDGFIIQDIGLARLIRAIAPNQEIHASTQMTIASAEGANFVKPLGFNRVVLSRELSLQQIKEIRQNTDLELEVFVHGALCVSYSGQCLTSENFGGRSGNRGQCAQSCRLPYRMFIDGKEQMLDRTPYLFSPHDLSALPLLKDLEKEVESLKVEGRLKSPEYVAAVARAYRAVLDNKPVDAFTRTALETLFSRGLSTGWLEGIDYQKLVEGSFSNHHGERLGLVKKVHYPSVWVEAGYGTAEPIPGDGILFEPAAFGGRLYGASRQGNLLKLDFGKDFDARRVRVGMLAFRNDSPAIEKELKKRYTERDCDRNIPIDITMVASEGKPLTVSIKDYDGNSVEVAGDIPDIAKTIRDDAADRAKNTLSALSGTAYIAQNVNVQLPGNLFVVDKALRSLRQEAIRQLDEKRKIPVNGFSSSASNGEFPVSANTGVVFLAGERAKRPPRIESQKPELSVLVRNPEQIEALKGLPITTVYMDFDWGVSYEAPLELVHSLGFEAGIATLRVHKPGESHYLRKIIKLAPERVLVRNLAALGVLEESEAVKNGQMILAGDYSLNIANSAAANYLISRGLNTYHPSLDLNATELFDLLSVTDPRKVEIALHQYLPAFHAEYCAFANFGAQAKRFPECGKFCTKHKVEILDHKGKRHYLQSDSECRNTLYLGSPRSTLRLLPNFAKTGVNKFRLEMLDDTKEMVRRKTKIYAEALFHKMQLDEAARQIGAEEKYGVSEGQLFNETRWQDRKKG